MGKLEEREKQKRVFYVIAKANVPNALKAEISADFANGVISALEVIATISFFECLGGIASE